MKDSELNELVDEYIQYTEWFSTTKSMSERMNPPGEINASRWERVFDSAEWWWRFIEIEEITCQILEF
jgi:ribosome-associated toxin RatA of RatAB toxin-antitoxin module